MSEDPAIYRQKCFHPPYCPNKNCRFHLIERESREFKEGARHKLHFRFYREKGWMRKVSYPYFVKRYRCIECKVSFCFNSFKLDYREKRWGLNSKIYRYELMGASNREIARQLNCSEHLVRGRLKKLAQWALIKQSERLEKFDGIVEPIAMDGLEAFAKSQYDPNNINQAIGRESLFIYDFNFCPLNRKGRMSERQKRIRNMKEITQGRYAPRAIRTSCKELFTRLYEMRRDLNAPLILLTDQHYQYRRAVTRDLAKLNIIHKTISSKRPRNYNNLIFPVNHSDLLIRHHIAAFKRETIAFSKTHERMIHKFILFMVHKNFMRPQFVKPHTRNTKANIESPAMALGLTDKILDFHEFFDIKRTLKQVPLNREWEHFYYERPTYEREKRKIA
jgi:hypothetical protein